MEMNKITKQFIKILRETQVAISQPDPYNVWHCGICSALIHVIRIRCAESYWDDPLLTCIFPSTEYRFNLHHKDKDRYIALRQMEGWERGEYWISPISTKKNCMGHSHTARIMLLELTALMLADGSIETPDIE